MSATIDSAFSASATSSAVVLSSAAFLSTTVSRVDPGSRPKSSLVSEGMSTPWPFNFQILRLRSRMLFSVSLIFVRTA